MKLSSVVIFVFAILYLHVANAQFGGGFPGDSRGGMRGGMPGRDDMRRKEPPIAPAVIVTPEDVEDRLMMIEDDLQLTAAQRALWIRFSSRMKAFAADIVRNRTTADQTEKQNPLQQIEHALGVLNNRLIAMEEIASTMKAAYSSLTPQQQSIADVRLINILRPLLGGTSLGVSTAPGSRR